MFAGVALGGAEAFGNQDEKRQLDAFSEELRRRPEVRIINKYALVMAYIRIGLKGIGALALLWATVVLLGGFISDLTKTDFWYLTIIAFIQAAGLSDGMGDTRLVFFWNWTISLLRTITLGEKHHDERTQLPTELSVDRTMRTTPFHQEEVDIMLGLIFLPVAFFAAYGPVLCVTLSGLRLAKQDYGIANGDASKANLKPALNLFYGISLSQSALSFFCTFGGISYARDLLDIVSRRLNGLSHEVLRAYMLKTTEMCQNNPASTVNWNLITYGADLLDSQLPEDYASGGRVLTMLIDQDTPVPVTRLLISSPRQRIQKLIGMLAWRSPAEQEMRLFAARIVEHLAGHLKLAHFPGALECISSLLDQEALHLPFVIGQREIGERIDKVLVCPGLRILENLAHDRHNCTLIYNTKDLLSKIVAPVSSNKLIEDIKSSSAWTMLVDRSLKVVSRLMGSSGSTGEEMRKLIADDSNAVNNLEAVLDMDMKSKSCIIELQMQALEVLTQLALHHPASTSAMKRREKIIKRALHIFITKDWMEEYLKDEKRNINKPTTNQQNNPVKKVSGARETEKMAKQAAESLVEKKMKEAQGTASWLKEKAGEALVMLSSDSEAMKSLKGCSDDVNLLTELLDSKIKTINCEISATETVKIDISIGCRISAAVVLKHLSNYVKEPTLRKVLAELFPIQAQASSTSTPRGRERAASGNDIENPTDGGQGKPSALQGNFIQQCERSLQAELLSLVAAIRASNKVDFSAILMSQMPLTGLEDFVVRLKKMVENNMYATPASLAIHKLTCEMVIEFLQHDQNVEVIGRHNIVGTLLEASETMAELESSILFAGVDHDCHGVPLKPLSSVLAKKAEDLLAQRIGELDIDAVPARAP